MRLFIIAALLLAFTFANTNHKIELLGIEPNAGPLSGNTRVLVRASELAGLQTRYPNPKCKFGRNDRIVAGTYVKCTPEPRKIWEMEPPTSAKTETCLQ